jgi:hypothetical protein
MSTLDTCKIRGMRGKKIDSRKGVEFTAEIATLSDWLELRQEIAATIRKSPLKASGLQEYCEASPSSELLRSIKLYSTENITEKRIEEERKKQIEQLLLSVPGVEGIRDLKIRVVEWSEKYHPEYEIDFPYDLFDLSIPSYAESAFEAPRAAHELYYDLDGAYDEDSPFVSATWPAAEDIDVNPPPRPTERVLRNKRLRNAQAVWEHRQQPSYKAETEGRRNKPPRKTRD